MLQTQERPEPAHAVALLPGNQHGSQERRSAYLTSSEQLPAMNTARLYSDEISRLDVLSTEEVIWLGQRIERGRAAAENPKQPGYRELVKDGEKARRQLIEANLRLVIYIARRYRGLHLDLMDLIQEGNLGLIHAVEKYDYRKGYRIQHLCHLVNSPVHRARPYRAGAYDPRAFAQVGENEAAHAYPATPTTGIAG